MLKVIGHRGAPRYAPENTLVSFSRALALGADMLELDVHICGSGEIVVIHDATVDRTTDGEGSVSGLTLREIKELDAGDGERIPTLEEVLRLVRGRVPINIELKGQGTPGPVHEATMRMLGSGLAPERFLISSFDPIMLAEYVSSGGAAPAAFLIEGSLGHVLDFASEMGLQAVHPDHLFTTSDFIGDAHGRGVEVNVWTVNEPARAEEMARIGVDGIFTDAPDMVIALRGRVMP